MKTLLLVGSPKPRNSSSEALGRYFVQQLGGDVDTFHAHKVFRSEKITAQFLQAFREAEFVVFSFPVYVDTVPYVLQRVMEAVADERTMNPVLQAQPLFCISNCGFPEADHTDLSLQVCEQFAQEAEMQWYGGVGLGEGGAVNGAPLLERGGFTRHLRAGLDAIAAAFLAGEPLPAEGVALVRKPLMPPRLYTFAGTIGWHVQSRQYEAMRQLHARPYSKN